MELLTVNLRVRSMADPILLCPFSDMHVGAADFMREEFARYVSWVASTPNAIAFGLGDMLEAITPSDRRFVASNIDPSYPASAHDNLVQMQMDDVVSLLRPVADRLLWLGKGNHELKVDRAGHFDVHGTILRLLGGERSDGSPSVVGFDVRSGERSGPIADAQYDVLVRLRVHRDRERRSFLVYCHHGWFAGTRGNRVNKLERLVRDMGVDLAIVGHGHSVATTGRIVHVRPDRTHMRMVERPALGIMVPTWKRGVVGGGVTYEASRGIRGCTRGAAVVRLVPATGETCVAWGPRPWEAL